MTSAPNKNNQNFRRLNEFIYEIWYFIWLHFQLIDCIWLIQFIWLQQNCGFNYMLFNPRIKEKHIHNCWIPTYNIPHILVLVMITNPHLFFFPCVRTLLFVLINGLLYCNTISIWRVGVIDYVKQCIKTSISCCLYMCLVEYRNVLATSILHLQYLKNLTIDQSQILRRIFVLYVRKELYVKYF